MSQNSRASADAGKGEATQSLARTPAVTRDGCAIGYRTSAAQVPSKDSTSCSPEAYARHEHGERPAQ